MTELLEKEITLDKSALKDFAIKARRKLKERVELQAKLMGFYEDNRAVNYEFEDDRQVKINGEFFSKKQVETLQREIKSKGYENLIDEVAYTWFNRFIALYYMEVNGYSENNFNIISNIDNLNQFAVSVSSQLNDEEKQTVISAVQNNNQDVIFKTLLIHQCNVMNKKLPFLFEQIQDYTELLFPQGMNSSDSVIKEMLSLDKSNWQVVEIIGWLYQYYITERKEEVVGLNKGIIEKEDIPSATQLFTPKWIVKYMVQNSLGKLWTDIQPSNSIKKQWDFYLETNTIKALKLQRRIEDITFLDPCCGSGHILVYAFDIFYQIYKSLGYVEDTIPELILKNNLYGLDICKRAIQLAQFALLMKARSYCSDIPSVRPKIYEIVDSQQLSNEALNLITNSDEEAKEIKNLVTEFSNAKCYGSLINPIKIDYNVYIDRIKNIEQTSLFKEELIAYLLPILQLAKILVSKYDIVNTNPPFLNKYNTLLKNFIVTNYKNYKEDLYAAFIYKCSNWTKENGYTAMMSPMTWMFIATHQKLREHILSNKTLSSLVRPEYHAFYSSAHVPICTFVINNAQMNEKGVFIDLNEHRGEDIQPILVKEAVINPKVNYRYEINSNKFCAIPGAPIAYWASDRVREIFKNEDPLGKIAEPKQGMATADNNRFLRFWTEVNISKVGFGFKSRELAKDSKLKWFPYNKGGEFRKWYGNNEYVVNWENDGNEIINFTNSDGKQLSRPQNTQFYFKESITWSFISSSCFGVRYSYPGALFDVGGSSAFANQKNIKYLIGFLCSKIVFDFLGLLNPTLNFQVGNVASLPIIFSKDEDIKNKIDNIVAQNIQISKDDWDSFETSWDFEQHPLLRFSNRNKGLVDYKNIHKVEPITAGDKVQDCFNKWKEYKQEQFNKLKANEEELNKLFIEIYGLQDEMTPEVDDKDITVRKADELRDIKSLLSYAVGCMFGRYSLDEKGLIYAGGEFDKSRYQDLEVDEDGILPILSDTWFDDDIIEELKRFLKKAFGELYFNENMQYIADVLGRKGSESAEDRIRTYFLKDFYKDHLQIYKKRPIYWMFTSGKEKAFNALIYLHRYDKTTLSRIRKDYLHEFQNKLDNAIQRAENEGNVKLTSLYSKYQTECLEFDRKIKDLADEQIELDLDDGVKVNYAKFQGLLEAEKDIVGKKG